MSSFRRGRAGPRWSETERITALVARGAERLGYGRSSIETSASASRYLSLVAFSHTDNEEIVTVRISDHKTMHGGYDHGVLVGVDHPANTRTAYSVLSDLADYIAAPPTRAMVAYAQKMEDARRRRNAAVRCRELRELAWREVGADLLRRVVMHAARSAFPQWAPVVRLGNGRGLPGDEAEIFARMGMKKIRN